MAGTSDLLGAARSHRAGRLMLYARRAVEGAAGGIHKSPQKGTSLEFKQHRPYVPGDEIRRIDWRAFARSDRFFIREFEEETNLQATIVLDASGSMAYGEPGTESDLGDRKIDFACRAAMVIANLLLSQGDAVGLMGVAGSGAGDLPARSRTGHLRRLADAMAELVPSGQADYNKLMTKLHLRARRRGLVIFFTDALFPPEPFVRALGQIAHRGAEVVVFQVLHRDERTFPFRDFSKFVDLEGEADIDSVDPSSVRKAYLERLKNLTSTLGRGLERHRIDLVPVTSDEDAGAAVTRYLTARMSGRSGFWREGATSEPGDNSAGDKAASKSKRKSLFGFGKKKEDAS